LVHKKYGGPWRRIPSSELVIAEALAAFLASLFCKELGLHNIILECNALQVVKARVPMYAIEVDMAN
jgi:hypothetical protein